MALGERTARQGWPTAKFLEEKPVSAPSHLFGGRGFVKENHKVQYDTHNTKEEDTPT